MAGNSIDFDPYELLDLKPECTDTQIVKAFRKAALKWHPDKNPGRKQAAQEMFLKISKAFELLSDAAARAAYDHVLAARTAHTIYVRRRQNNESEKRRKLREELERREANVLNVQHEKEKAKRELEKEIQRLRKEGSKLLQRERENIEQEIRKNATVEEQSGDKRLLARYKLRWKRETDQCNYDEDDLRKLFSKYGHISDVIVSSSSRGMAILEFDELVDVDGIEKETGKPDVPIATTCLQKPSSRLRSSEIQRSKPVERPMTSVEFADFEAEVLATMMAGSKRKADKGESKFDNL
uniref:DnaJ domain-containing protein n=2 Tax=Wuchereria bancrofti TaxID=6293 RepID=A0AAF5PSS3_WUCBA